MGGYRHEAKTYKLTFEEFPGLEVVAKSVSTGRLMKLMRMAVRLQDKESRDDLTEEDAVAVEALFSGFAKALVSWNLEYSETDEDHQEGDPVPATLSGVNEQEFDFTLTIINSWIEAVASPSKSLGKDSNSGPQFPEALIPMATR